MSQKRKTPKYAALRFTKNLRACLKCKQIKDMDSFRQFGCENCDYDYKDIASIIDHTTKRFEGFVALCNPKRSWVSRWIKAENKVEGLYALKVYSTQQRTLDEIEREEMLLAEEDFEEGESV